MSSIWKPGHDGTKVLTVESLLAEVRWLRLNHLSRNQIVQRLTPWADPSDLYEVIEELSRRWNSD